MVTATTMPYPDRRVTVGVDTHADLHVAAVLDEQGRLLSAESFPTTAAAHRRLESWATAFGRPVFGVEGTGAYGAGLARHLLAHGHRVVEVDRPHRRTRRQRGKSDAIDAEAAARAVLAGTATGEPKRRNGPVEAIRALRVARRSAIKARSQAAHQLHCLVTTAPDPIRDRLRQLQLPALVESCARSRPGAARTAAHATRFALRMLARRYQALSAEVEELDAQLEPLVRGCAAPLLAIQGVGVEVAGQLLVTAGDNPERLRSESSFAHLCGVAPLPASSGKTQRHRLNRGGDRQANAALYHLVLTRLRWNPRTIAYVTRRTQQGRTKPEIIRCLKRYVAREVFAALQKCRA